MIKLSDVDFSSPAKESRMNGEITDTHALLTHQGVLPEDDGSYHANYSKEIVEAQYQNKAPFANSLKYKKVNPGMLNFTRGESPDRKGSVFSYSKAEGTTVDEYAIETRKNRSFKTKDLPHKGGFESGMSSHGNIMP